MTIRCVCAFKAVQVAGKGGLCQLSWENLDGFQWEIVMIMGINEIIIIMTWKQMGSNGKKSEE